MYTVSIYKKRRSFLLGKKNKNYSILIHSELRQQGRFAGFSMYISNTDVSNIGDEKGLILCYKDEPPIPPLNFTTLCKQHGRYVIFYNERLDDIPYPDEYIATTVYTELCEVIVKGTKYVMFKKNQMSLII